MVPHSLKQHTGVHSQVCKTIKYLFNKVMLAYNFVDYGNTQKIKNMAVITFLILKLGLPLYSSIIYYEIDFT